MLFHLHPQVSWKSKSLHQFKSNTCKSKSGLFHIGEEKGNPRIVSPPKPLPSLRGRERCKGEFQGTITKKMSHDHG